MNCPSNQSSGAGCSAQAPLDKKEVCVCDDGDGNADMPARVLNDVADDENFNRGVRWGRVEVHVPEVEPSTLLDGRCPRAHRILKLSHVRRQPIDAHSACSCGICDGRSELTGIRHGAVDAFARKGRHQMRGVASDCKARFVLPRHANR